MGIDVYVRRKGHTPEGKQPAAPSTEAMTKQPKATTMQTNDHASWRQHLCQRISQCTACALAEKRTQTVPATGASSADWMLIGEAPGAEEDRQGEPFVGRAGQLLNKILNAIGLQRKEVYITNSVKCRPPDNRNPRPEEVASCRHFLDEEVLQVKPKIILALGGVAANNLLDCEKPVGQLRGQVFQWSPASAEEGFTVPLLVTYHPAYLLRQPSAKRAVWEDLQQACQVVGRDLS